MKKSKKDLQSIIVALHAEGLIDKEIGLQLNLCGDDIYYHRKKLGLPANGPTKSKLVLDENGYRQCPDCKKFLPIDEFEIDKNGYVRRKCKSCKKEDSKRSYQDTKTSLEKTILFRIRYWKKRAKDEGIIFNIDYDYVMNILEKQKLKCFYSDINMLLDGTREEHNYSLSIDRVIPELGYVKGNIVFCIHKINMIKNNMTLEEIKNWTPRFYKKIIESDFLNLEVILAVKQAPILKDSNHE